MTSSDGRHHGLIAPRPGTGGRRRDLRIIFTEGVVFSVMVGIGECYLAAFVLALGMGEVASGLVTTVPLLVGGVIQLVTPIGIRWIGSRRRWSVLCAALQAAAFAPLLAGGWRGSLAGWAVFAAASLYWAAGMAVGPAWNVWVERLVPRSVRIRFFARRTSAVQLGVLAGLMTGGMILAKTQTEGTPLRGFAIIFAVAGLCRVISMLLLAAQSARGAAVPRDEAGLPALPLLRRVPAGDGARLLAYMLTLTAGVMIAGPYFSPYMLVRLELSYVEYMTLVGTALVAKVLVLPLLAPVARRFGLVFLLRAAWVGIVPLAVLWLVSDSYLYLIGLQIVSGTAWAAHEYVTFLLLFETIHAQRRVGILTAYNLGNAVATVGGSLLGGWIFEASGGGAGAGYVAIFAASSAARAVCLVLLARVRPAGVHVWPAVFRITAVRPATGAVLRPILSTFRRHRPRPENLADRSSER